MVDVVLSQKAAILLKEMPDVDLEELKNWYLQRAFVIGTRDVLDYVLHIKQK